MPFDRCKQHLEHFHSEENHRLTQQYFLASLHCSFLFPDFPFHFAVQSASYHLDQEKRKMTNHISSFFAFPACNMCDFYRAKWRFILRMRLLFNHIIADMLCIRSSPKFQLFCSRFLNPLSRITVYRLCTYFHRGYVRIVFTYKAVFFQNNLPMRNFSPFGSNSPSLADRRDVPTESKSSIHISCNSVFSPSAK